jgi:hypothetical protein
LFRQIFDLDVLGNRFALSLEMFNLLTAFFNLITEYDEGGSIVVTSNIAVEDRPIAAPLQRIGAVVQVEVTIAKRLSNTSPPRSHCAK